MLWVLDRIIANAHFILPAFYVLFIGGTIAFVVSNRRRWIKRIYLSGFLSIIIIVTLVGVPLMPIVDMHKFSQPISEQETVYEIHIVDDSGKELHYDTRASYPLMGSRESSLGETIATEYDRQDQLEIASVLIENAEDYRTAIENGEADRDPLSPPRYVADPKWDSEDIQGISDFRAITVYKVELTFSEDNSAVSRNERVAVQIDTTTGEVQEGDVS